MPCHKLALKPSFITIAFNFFIVAISMTATVPSLHRAVCASGQGMGTNFILLTFSQSYTAVKLAIFSELQGEAFIAIKNGNSP